MGGVRVRDGQDNAEQEALQADARKRGAEENRPSVLGASGACVRREGTEAAARRCRSTGSGGRRAEGPLSAGRPQGGGPQGGEDSACEGQEPQRRCPQGCPATGQGVADRTRDRRDKSEATERRQEHSHPIRYSGFGCQRDLGLFRAQSTSHGSPPRLFKPHSTWRLLKRAFSALDSPGNPRGSGRDRCTSARGTSCRPSALLVRPSNAALSSDPPPRTRSVRASPPRRRRVRRGGRRRRRGPGRRAR